ncbi:translocation/assembly module TamB domain-containing protein [Hymenobacter saemangeumensis]|uniref:translocation/assembly module TamB domain-containing protein n=1 Tax=Hymenobacter saemangeumensis TaxID=1084522 RepID=UPI0031E8C612
MPTFLRRTLYVLFGLIGLVLLLLIVAVVALQFPGTQDLVARKAEGYLRDKLGTEVRIGKFRTDFRHAINLDGVYLEDQQRDTLLSVGHLGVSIDLWALTKSQINISEVELNDGRVRLTRTEPDSVNNYDFIIKAFTDPTAPVDTTSAGFKYDIGQLRLTNIYFTQADQVTGSDLRARLGELTVNMDEVDVDNSIYKVDNAVLRNAAVAMVQTKTAPEVEKPGPEEPLTVQFGLNKATLENVGFTYRNTPAAQFISTKVGLADVTARNIDLQKARVDLDKLTLKNTTFAYAQNENVPVEQRVVNPAEAVRKLDEATEKASAQPLKWRVTLNESDISGLDVKFDNFNEPKQRTRIPALDYNHLHFTDLVLNTRDFSFSENRTTAKVDNLAGKEQSGFRVDRWRANVVYDSVQIRLDSLDLVTPHTRIRRTLAIGFESLAGIADNVKDLKIEGDLRDVRLGFRDILYLAPDLAGTPPFNTGPNQSVLISGLVNGRVGDFRVRNLEFVGLRNTQLRASGRIQGLPNVDARLFADLDIQRFTTTEADLKSVLPRGTIPANINLPASMSVAGTFRGRPTAMNFDTNLRLSSSYGDATAVVNMEPGPKGQEPVKASFALQNFNLGKLLTNPQLGRVTATGQLNARGLDPAQMRGQLVATVQRAEYQGYTYRNVKANVDIDRNRYDIAVNTKGDPNLDLDLKAVVNLRDPNNPSYEVTSLNLRGANLAALGFATGDLRVQGDLKANLRGSDLNSLNGTFSGNRIVIVKDGKPFALDSLNGRIVQVPGRTELDVTSTGVIARLRGNIRLGDIAGEIQRHIDRYFDLPGVQYVANAADRQFTYSLRLRDPRLVTNLVPDLKSISPFTLAGAYDSRAASLTAQTSIPLIKYQTYVLDSLRLDVGSDPQKLDYALRLRQARQDTSMRLPYPRLAGSVANNRVGTRLQIGQPKGPEKLDLAGVLQVINRGEAYAFSFDPKLVLNDMAWTVAPSNELRYTMKTGAIRAENVRLSQGSQLIELQTLPGAEYPLQARLANLDLNMLARAAGQTDSLIGGTLNGQAVVRSLGQPRMAFTSDLTLNGLAYQKTVLGDLALQATNPSADRYQVDARLTGGPNNNDVRVNGFYLANGALNMTANVSRFYLGTVQPFTLGQLKEMGGFLSGQLAIGGTTAAPQIIGQLNTQDAGFTVTQLGAPYRLPNQSLTLDNQGLRLDNLTILDSLGNKAVVNGYLYTKNYVDYRFDMRAVTKDFLAVQSTAADNPLYYGKLIVDSDTRITGTLLLPIVRTTATVKEGSDLTVVSPAEDPVTVEREGIVEFVDMSLPLDSLLARQMPKDTAETVSGYDVAATVTVTEATPFTIIIDPASGDNLKVRANGTLNTAIDQTGNITLSGRVDVAKGQYRLSLYDLVEREFDIAPGSYIIWSGDPFNADINVAAIYKVKAPPAELLSAQGLTNDNLATIGRNQLPFRVYLNVTGQLLKPTIAFDIQLPEESRTELRSQIEARLSQLRQPSQTTELNKQVFSLLVLNRFMADDPFQSSGGSFVNAQLRGSASQVLTQQLQNLTGSYLSNLGVELGVNSYADYTSGSEQTRTDLNVAVRRQLLNNRLTVRLGTDVPLAGGGGSGGGANQASQGQAGGVSQFAGDVSVEYNILANGRLRLRAFRNNAYGDIDGQYVRTGASLIFQRDYRDLAELFRGIDKDVKEERRENRKREKEEKKVAQDSVQAVAQERRDTIRSGAPPSAAGR